MTGENAVSSVLASLGGGSGIDIRKLAEDLTNVEKVPAEERLNSLKEEKSAQISAYAVLKFNVEEIMASLDSLDDVSDLMVSEAASSDSSKIAISSASALANAGSNSLAVTSLASNQINISNSYDSSTEVLNSGADFSITITGASGTTETITIAGGSDTPAGIVAAVNAQSSNVSAALVAVDANSTSYKIMLNGTAGAANSFTITSDLSDADLGFHDSSNGNTAVIDGVYSQQLASNSVFSLNGVTIERSTNNITDVIDGISFDLKGVHASGDTTRVTVEKSGGGLKEKLRALVEAYNDTRFALAEISDPDSSDEDVGGALASDFATIRQVRSAIYNAVTQDSSTPSGSINALRDIGVEITRYGDLQFNEVTFDAVMLNSANDVATMLSAGTDNQSKFDGQPQGLARDAIADLELLTDSVDGIFSTRTQSSIKALSSYEEKLEELDLRMTNLFERYMSQFTVMEALVSQLNTTRTSLSDTWMNMGNFNKK